MANKNSTTTELTSTNYENDAALWQTRYRLAYSNQLPMFKRFADWYDLMYAVITKKNMSLWRSKIFLPELASKAWNMISKFIALKPGFEVRVRDQGISTYDLGEDENIEERAIKATLKLEYDYDNPDTDRPIREKLLACLTDATVTGTGLAKVVWCSEKKTRMERVVKADGTIDLSKEKVIETVEGYNDIKPVNIFNVFVAPSSHDLYNAPWLIIKEFKTLDQLKAVNDGKGVEIYKNLAKLEGARSTGDPLSVYKKSRNKMTVQTDPVVADKTIDFIEIYECYDRATNTIVTYANAGITKNNEGYNWVEIRNQKNVYWHGKYPLVRFVVKQRPYDFWGEGIFETNHSMQMAMNDVFNHYMDNWNLAVDGMLMSQESSGINDYIVEPGGLITYRTEEPKQFKFPEPNPASLNMVMNTLEGSIEKNTISQYAAGTPDSQTDKTRGTKGGIEALQNAADDAIAFMRTNFQESIKMIGQMWLVNNQQFMMKPITMRLPGRNGTTTAVKIKPEDIQGNLELRVDESSMTPISDDQAKAQYVAFVQQLMQMQQASVAQHQLTGTQPVVLKFGDLVEEMAERFGFRNIQGILGQMPTGPTPQQQQQMAEQQHELQKEQMKAQTEVAKAQSTPQHPQSLQDKMIESLNYRDVPDDIKRQMEAQAGFQPSQTGVNVDQMTKLHQAHNQSMQTMGQLQNQQAQNGLQQQQNNLQAVQAAQQMAQQMMQPQTQGTANGQ